MIFMACLIMGMYVVAFFSILFYLIKPNTFLITINNKPIGRLRIIVFWILYLLLLLILLTIVIPTTVDSSTSLSGIFLGILFQIGLCMYGAKKHKFNIVKKAALLSSDKQFVNKTQQIEEQSTDQIDTEWVPPFQEIVSTDRQSLIQDGLKQKKLENPEVSLDEKQNLILLLTSLVVQLKRQRKRDEEQNLIDVLKPALLQLEQQEAFKEKQRLVLLLTNALQQLKHQKMIKERQKLIVSLTKVLLLLKQRKEGEKLSKLQLITTETLTNPLSNGGSLPNEKIELNKSKSSIFLSNTPDEDGFVTFQLDSQSDVKEKSIPSAPKTETQKAFGWVSPDRVVEINGLEIRGGMFYLGSKRSSLYRNEPSFVDTSLPISHRKVDLAERLMGYWPSYSQISSEARRAYLEWLADGRCNPTADIGYVFLFFYGLEQRALVDAQTDLQAKQEIPFILSEVTRLLSIYGSSGSFKNYASRFIDYISLDTFDTKSYLKDPPKIFGTSYELPMSYRIALGQLVIDKHPLSVDWALAWVLVDGNIIKRTPAIRCADYFEVLFKQNYVATYGEGFILSPNRTKLKITYFPASSNIPRDLTKNINDLPDVSVVSKHVKKLQVIVDQTTQQLESYSRYLGRNPDSAKISDVIFYLPMNLWPENLIVFINEIKEKVLLGPIAIELKSFLMDLGCNVQPSRSQWIELVSNLANIGLGIEPDIFVGAKMPKNDEFIVVFQIGKNDINSRSESDYQVAIITLDLASAVALADGDVSEIELNLLQGYIESWVHLSEEQQNRLKAILMLRKNQPSSLLSLKKKLEILPIESRESIAQVLIHLVQVDGTVDPAEVKLLEKIYNALQLNRQQLYKGLHTFSTNENFKPLAGVSKTYIKDAKFKLNAERIESLQKETALVSALLANVFVEEETQPNNKNVIEPEHEPSESNPTLFGLDVEHSAFLRRLITRPQWSREELLNLAADFDLMLDGALENINESTLDHLDEQIIEGDDLLEVNQTLLEKIEI